MGMTHERPHWHLTRGLKPYRANLSEEEKQKLRGDAILKAREMLRAFLDDGHDIGADVDVGHVSRGYRHSTLGTLEEIHESDGMDWETGIPPGPVRLVVSGEAIRMRSVRWILEPYTFDEVHPEYASRRERHEEAIEQILDIQADEGDTVRVTEDGLETYSGPMEWARSNSGLIYGVIVHDTTKGHPNGQRIRLRDMTDIEILKRGR